MHTPPGTWMESEAQSKGRILIHNPIHLDRNGSMCPGRGPPGIEDAASRCFESIKNVGSGLKWIPVNANQLYTHLPSSESAGVCTNNVTKQDPSHSMIPIDMHRLLKRDLCLADSSLWKAPCQWCQPECRYESEILVTVIILIRAAPAPG
eukprot:1028253-Rhodomonas_salina.2